MAAPMNQTFATNHSDRRTATTTPQSGEVRSVVAGAYAADVPYRLRQYRLDAGVGRGHGGRKEPARRARLAAPIGAVLLLAAVWVAVAGATV
jgi:hypothetical protein